MVEMKHRFTLGGYMVVSHFVLILLLFGIFFTRGMNFAEFTTSLAIIVPMFASYTTVIIKFMIRHRSNLEEGVTLRKAYVFLSFLIPTLFFFAVLVMIGGQVFSIGFENFEEFKKVLGVTESAFGVYVGYFIYAMFRDVKE